MPYIYLSPSTQEANLYVTGGTEEEYMNLIADAMEPFLEASGIKFTRNDREKTAAAAIRESNSGNYQLHFAIHSNAAPEDRYGEIRGVQVYYFPHSLNGRRAAQIVAENMSTIYPIPSLVEIRPTTNLGEVDMTRAPSVLVEVAYHDNTDDANWITGNIDEIARTLAQAIADYFGVPLVEPSDSETATVKTGYGNLNIRQRPNTGAKIIASAPNGASITVLGDAPDGWLVVRYNGVTGYASGEYIER